MAHPYLMAGAFGPDTVEQRAIGLDLKKGAAEFALMAGFDLTAKLGAHGLLAITDAEHRDAGLEDLLRRTRAADVDGRMRAAGEDNALRPDAVEGFAGRLEGHDLAIGAGLAHAPGNELRDLAAEIDDEDGVGMMVRRHVGPLKKNVCRRNGFV